ncbi:hypothetical protein [Haloarcula laminariae]|uniref:hypothetical protein n=1 Tax=Haloarcula laminariae TaxID=2961577 RepID=UPI00240646A0|nr:hypothetical protein [Halomicroarcula sp. FL173]
MNASRYNINNLAFALKNPSIILGEINRVCTRFNSKYNKKYQSSNGIYIMDEDWDNLILLDGCRFDTFSDVNHIGGELESRVSRASESLPFMKENFEGKEFHDTIYITANPYAYNLNSSIFHKIINVYETGWNDDYQTVMPETVTKKLIEINESYPNKRLIAHYMQPHVPFIGKKGSEMAQVGFGDRASKSTHKETSAWKLLQYGLESKKKVKEAYRENLRIVLKDVENVLEHLDGKSVVSSDHGNLMGERLSPIPVRGYGHPRYLYNRELRTVPWLVVQRNGRKDIVSERPERNPTNKDHDEIEDRLQALGYE